MDQKKILEVYNSLCRELDYLLVNIVADLENIISAKVKLEIFMNNGFVNIAKTRYISGSSSVSMLQLPTELSNPIEPQALVHRTEEKNGSKIEIYNNLDPQNSGNIKSEGLRNRQHKDDKEEESKNGKVITNDPIRLFGVLVPQSLRIAQKSFITSTNLVGKVAEAQASLEKKLARYRKLQYMKKSIFDDTPTSSNTL